MRSVRGRLVRLMLKHVVGPKLRGAGPSVERYRKLDRLAIKGQRAPAGTEVSAVVVGDTPAEWVSGPDPAADRAVLYLHGGGFIMGSPATHRELAARLAAAADTRALVLDYRLAPEHPFPAALEDAISAYRWLLESGYREDRLVIGGDSSGGGLALQTLIALRRRGRPLPAAAFFLSPQVDWVRFDGESFSTRARLDPLLTPEVCRGAAPHYVGDNDPAEPLLCPIRVDLSGLPPLCIHVGDHEVLLSDSLRLAGRARAAGVDVDLKVWPGMWHVFQSAARFVPEGRESIREIGRFVLSAFRRDRLPPA